MNVNSEQIGFIGFGKMAKALWAGLSKTTLVNPKDTLVYVPSTESQRNISLNYGLIPVSLETLLEKSKILFFCVKPQTLSKVFQQIPTLSEDAPLIISILAGTPIQVFLDQFGESTPVIRLMPNTPVQIGEGVTGISYSKNIAQYQKDKITQLLKKTGLLVPVEERQMDAITALSGSGPAFFYKIIEDFAKAGELSGLTPSQSLKIATKTMLGAAKMLQDSEKTPAHLIEEVCSPNGTTEAGLQEYQRTQIGAHLQSVIAKSIERSKELKKEN